MMSFMPRSCNAGEQLVEVGQRPEQRVDVLVVGDVVAVVVLRRAVDRRQPDHVGAQPRDVVEVVDDAPQVADAVAVGVGERARVDLVDDGLGPPRGCEFRHTSSPSPFATEKTTARGAP
jgi:hypothetical protein